jgi:3-oxoacyl-[acyl-carrier-protein] synthase-1
MIQVPERIVVTGTGIISALGCGLEQHAQSLAAGRHGLRFPEILQTRHAHEFLVGEVPFSNEDLAHLVGLQPGSWASRTTLLTLAAFRDLVKGDGEWLKSQRLAFVNSNTVGGMSEVERCYLQFLDPADNLESQRWTERLDCADSTEQIADFFGLRPLMATISTACSSSANAIIVASRMLRQGLADVAIAGGSDALSRFTLNGFLSLKNMDRQPCRPFDRDRNGLNLGEGAAYLMLERENDAIRRGAEILGLFSGWSNSNDAYHPTAPSPDGAGAQHAMNEALKKAKLSPVDIGYINAHGTATINNDPAEGRAIATIWGEQVPPFSSTKPFTGHTLAAAGATEAIIAVNTLRTGIAPANLNWSSPIEELNLEPLVKSREINPEHVMSNSFGFGGNNVSLVFSQL